jgi:aminoglycoside phosphotransferase (APT) family kinase protein
VRKGIPDLESEEHALDIVREQTCVPVPRIFSYSTTRDFQLLEMHRIDGETLEECWATLSDQERRKIARQVVAYSRDLHKLQNTMVGRAIDSRGTIIDRIPFEKPLSAKDFIVSWATRYSTHPKIMSFIEERLSFCDQTIALTHLDLYPANIIIKERVASALIDFESCVYVPKFWGALEIFRRAAQRPQVIHNT